MRKTIVQTQAVTIETDIVCDACGLESHIGSMESGEYLKIDFRGGYGSIFGDGNAVRADICQKCLQNNLGQFLKILTPSETHE